MLSKAKWFTSAIALGVLIAFSIPSKSHAEEKAPAATGSITGKVVDDKGAGVAGARVRLNHPRPPREGGGNGKGEQRKPKDQAAEPADKPKDDKGGEPAGPGQGGGGNRPNRPPPVAETTTDNDGNFTLSDVPVGDYMLFSGVRGQGRANERITVKAGETTNVTMTLKPQDGRGRGGNRGGDKGGQKGDAPKPAA